VKRAFDLLVSGISLLLLAPLLGVVAVAIWLQDFRSPFYIAPRVALGFGMFRMVKFRSMTVGADRSGVDSTSSSDPRITSLGKILRAYKLDELMQLWNVFRGDMSFVGPRPQVLIEAQAYTEIERKLLSVRPGITDLSSIVFSDEGEILKGKSDPDLAYNQLIRPWKSRLGLIYVDKHSMILDLEIVALTAVAFLSRRKALTGVQRILKRLDADELTREVAKRLVPLVPCPPPGAATIVTHRGAYNS
jgi:lipopolysaccharide/colanic/teichoic acid biosynthesis glycosyltransferase